MNPPRFFIEPADIEKNVAQLKGPEAHHLASVLRLKPNQGICLFDGTGQIYQAIIKSVSRNNITSEITSSETYTPPLPHLHLGQALLKGKKMDLIVQKANELGIVSLIPLASAYCDVKEITGVRESRWQRVALESCKQCGRPLPLECAPVQKFKDLVTASAGYDTRLILWEKESTTDLKGYFSPNQSVQSVLILIGPEGGFSQPEIDLAAGAGFQPVSLGKMILRAETATLAAMAILQFLLGNLDLK